MLFNIPNGKFLEKSALQNFKMIFMGSNINKTKMLKLCSKLEIKKLEDGKKEIENASTKFLSFLTRNAMAAYNVGMEKYLTHSIGKEEERVAVSGDKVRLEGLRASLATYIEEKRILETEL